METTTYQVLSRVITSANLFGGRVPRSYLETNLSAIQMAILDELVTTGHVNTDGTTYWTEA
jgi:hypothetical protein